MRESGIEPVLMTVARAFDGLGREEGARIAETALYYNSCLDYDGLIKAGKMYNDTIIAVALSEHVQLIDLAEEMKGRRQFFVDAGHFNYGGEQHVAAYLARELEQRGLLEPHINTDNRLSGQ